jgi:polar amino acid transport system ATP-binding protein
MIEVRGLRKEYKGAAALDGVDLRVGTGEVLCLIGPSGSGKSTLLRCIHFLEEPTAGEIRLDGARLGYHEDGAHARRMRGVELARMRSQIGMVFQLFYLWPHMTALENVALGLREVRKMSWPDAVAVAQDYLAKVELSNKLDAYPEHMSGGQRQRVAIARALAMQPKVMLFDEPTSALDPELVGEVLAVIERIAGEGITMLIATHEMAFARRVADRIVFLDQGRIVEEGAPDEVFERPRNDRLKRFLDKILT